VWSRLVSSDWLKKSQQFLEAVITFWQPFYTHMCHADDVRKGYKGCFADGDGAYVASPWGGTRTLPAALNTNRLTHEQCALAAAQGGYEVYAMQASGYCFMGTLADVVQMKRKLDDSTCSTIPCLTEICLGMVNKVYSVGVPLTSFNC
jgi:hypothetical protein